MRSRVDFSLVLLAVAVFVGLAVPPLSSAFASLLYPSLFFIMLFSLMQLDLVHCMKQFFAQAKFVIFMAGLQMLVLPIALWGMLGILNASTQTAQIILLTACASSVFGASAFAGLINLNKQLALSGVIVSTLILPISLPIFLQVTNVLEVEFDFSVYLSRLTIFIVCPVVIAVCFARYSTKKIKHAGQRYLPSFIIVALIVFAIAIMDGVAQTFFQNRFLFVYLFGLAIGIHVGFYMISSIVCRSAGRKVAMTAGILSAYRNLGLLLAVTGPFLPAEFFIFTGLWQVPMYVSPLVLHFLFTRHA